MAKLRASSVCHHRRAGRAPLSLRRRGNRTPRRDWLNALVQLGDDEPIRTIFRTTSSSIARYLHGDPSQGTRRGIAMNSRHSAVINSYLSDFKEVGADSQAIAGWNGPGPFTIANNYLEAAGENVMFGGADPSIQGLVPADIVVAGNHFAKPRPVAEGASGLRGHALGGEESLRAQERPPRGRRGQSARAQLAGRAERVRDSLDRAKPDRGRAVVGRRGRDLRKQRRSPRPAPASTSSGATTTIRASRRAASRSRATCSPTSAVDGDRGGSSSCWTAHGTSASEHNTAFQTGPLVFGDGAPHTGFVFENNIVLHNEYGIVGSGTRSGHASTRPVFPWFGRAAQLLVGADARSTRATTSFPPRWQRPGSSSRPTGLSRDRGGPLRGDRAATGAIIGADMEVLTAVDRVSSGKRATDGEAGRSARRPRCGAIGVSATGGWRLTASAPRQCSGRRPAHAGVRLRRLPAHRLAACEAAANAARSRADGTAVSTIIVVAHNEDARIEARIENLLALDYPRDRLQIIVGSDGSSDETAAARPTVRGSRRPRGGVSRVARQGGRAQRSGAPARGAKSSCSRDARQRFDAGGRAGARVALCRSRRGRGQRRTGARQRRRRQFGGRRGGILLALREVHPSAGESCRVDGGRTGVDLCDPARALRADPARHDARRRRDSAADRPGKDIGAVSSRRRKAYQTESRTGSPGVRPEGPDDCRHVPAVRARAVAVEPACGIVSGSRPCRTRGCGSRCPCSTQRSSWQMSRW